ncbi:MAG TPA: DmsE family decaheme c-type cytochrome, partial [Burkholderiales bacterium]|nr:DmsE family decaheme c-type cytochrome [Burkholderiales bacterium]
MSSRTPSLAILQALAIFLASAFFTSGANAQQAPLPALGEAPPPAAQTAEARKDLVLRGDAQCTRCHDAEDNPALMDIGKTRHGTLADGRTPTCTSCHGASEAHMNPGAATKRPKPDRTFTKNSLTPIAERNEACMSCHRRDSNRAHWEGSAHQARDVACTSCHQIHTQHDAVRERRTQPEVCFTCHKEQRTMINRPSRHPIPEGKVVCSDCHNPHGSVGPKLVKRDSVNDTCYTCHMEKRGPFVHNHEPVQEDCMNCHNPHGTVTENLLKARAPFLCHQCHTPHGPNVPQLLGRQVVPFTDATTGKNAINVTMARGCLNCHTEVHGSNNPSTTNPTPQFRLR